MSVFKKKIYKYIFFFAIRFLPIVLASFVKSIWSSESPGILPQKPSVFFPNGMEPWILALLDISSFKYGRYLSIECWHIKSDYKNKQTNNRSIPWCDILQTLPFTLHIIWVSSLYGIHKFGIIMFSDYDVSIQRIFWILNNKMCLW